MTIPILYYKLDSYRNTEVGTFVLILKKEYKTTLFFQGFDDASKGNVFIGQAKK